MGVDVVACVATNDAYVMHAWGEQQKATGLVRMLSDSAGELTKALGQDKPSGVLTRSNRYSMARVPSFLGPAQLRCSELRAKSLWLLFFSPQKKGAVH